MRYERTAGLVLPGLAEEIAALAERAGRVVDVGAASGPRADGAHHEDDLTAHFRSYIESCAVSATLRPRLGRGEWTAGYSMGLFAAVCHSAALTFEEGLLLTQRSCELSRAVRAATRRPYGMAVIVGLTREEVTDLAPVRQFPLEIADVCTERTVVLAGPGEALDAAIHAARDAGCLQARRMPVDLPYHSSLMRSAAEELRTFADSLPFRPPDPPLVSCASQRLLTTAQDVREEAASNIAESIHWHATLQTLLKLGADTFVESGLSDSLSKLARFSEGSFRFFHPRTVSRL
jgi:malonyl CoA-acyl carrier protein transacylase